MVDHRLVEIDAAALDAGLGEELEHLAPPAPEIDDRAPVGDRVEVEALAVADQRLRAPEDVFEADVER